MGSHRGVAERRWCSANPKGSKAEFNSYYRELSGEKLKVRVTMLANAPTDITP